jgi:hypothetical protein
MNRFKPTICALVLTMTISSSALAGNIGGLKTNAAGNIGGLRTSSTGNIGGLRTNSVSSVDTSSNSLGRRLDIELAFSGNIGGMIRLLIETAALF